MNQKKSSITSVLEKFLPRNENGEAVRTLDERFGFPETYLVSLKNEDRLLVIEALKEYEQKHGDK